jgi:hypothetical protein
MGPVKFKSLFLLFNMILLLLLLFIGAFPFLLFGTPDIPGLFQTGWPLILVLLLILAGFDIFYGYNRRLFQLLEKEDWPALSRYLEKRIIRDGHYSPRLIRLLANTYLVLSDSASVLAMENKAAIVNPALVDANALIFGAARILEKDLSGAVNFFARMLRSRKTESADWIRWYYGFSLLLDQQYSPSGDQFLPLALGSKEGVITGLSAFFLSESLSRLLPQRGLEFAAAALDGKNRLLKTFPSLDAWNREVKRTLNAVHAAILSRFISEATAWLFGPRSPRRPPEAPEGGSLTGPSLTGN